MKYIDLIDRILIVIIYKKYEIIFLVEENFDLGLHAPAFVERVIDRGIDLGVAGQRDGVVDGREHLGAMHEADAGAPRFRKLVFIPERETVPRHLGHDRASAGGGGRADDTRVLIGVADGGSPPLGKAAAQADENPPSPRFRQAGPLNDAAGDERGPP